MISLRQLRFTVIVFAAALVPAIRGIQAAELPPAPTLSKLVPVDDLAGQVEYYVEELEDCVQDLQEYEDSVEKIERYSSSLAVIALAIGLHDQDSRLRKASPVLVKACQELAASKDFAGARAGVARVKAALSASGDPSKLKWTKVAEMHALMEQVPLINTRLKRYMRRFDRGASQIAGNSAALAVIGQGSLPNADETAAPDRVAEWYKFCVQMRDSSAALNKAAHEGNATAAKTAMDALQKTCDECHAIFHPDEQ